MQPTATATVPTTAAATTEMDLQAMQSMSWLFKKENFFNLAQFYQHTSALKDKDIAELKGQVANLENKLEANMDRHSFETEISAKEKQISQLVEELQRREATIAKLHENYSKLPLLEEQLEQKNQYISKLEAKLDSQKDYDDIKRELSVLKSSNSNLPENKLEQLKQEQPKSPVNQDNEGDLLPRLPEPQQTPPPPHPQTPLPPPFQNVEAFGTLLGEEIIANWRRSIDLNNRIINPNQPTDVQLEQQQHHHHEKSATSTPQPQDIIIRTDRQDIRQDLRQDIRQSSPLMLNGNPKSPEDNNNHHVSNNNIPLSATVCAVNNFLKSEDLKNPYRFEEHRSFRFAEDLGMPPGSMVGRLGESLIPKGDPMEARLQEMLRFNMDKYASQNLDTLHISRRVRELLSIHNIGQRLFAKYILGLSQGTVSELLSKPKPWDKLTEKGRDSYRKMHAWSCDDNAVLLLKSLIPKKDNFSSGKESGGGGGGIPTFGRPEPNDYNDDRIVHMLSEASQQMHKNIEDTHSNEDSKSPQGCPSPYSKESSQNRKLKKYENDDIPQEKVARIYQEEMAKLMGRRIDDMRNTRDLQGMFLPQIFSGNPMERSQDDVRALFDAYHQLAKMNQCPNPQLQNLGLLALHQQAMAHQGPMVNNGAQDLSLPKEKAKMVNGTDDKDKEDDKHNSAFSLVRPKLESGTPQTTSSTASSPLGNSILPPAMTPTDEFSSSAAASPLQRMASITNSLISQPPQQPHPTSSQRPLKAVLPPITQQQFDLYNNLNTEDIVKKVKEQLSQYSISQRLFGESVLGLSQGSVSDLLARPKPWHMLTQKGREPFIRMKMFLEDDNAVHKLVASQYKIAPEKLMRTGGYGGVPHYITAAVPKPMPTTPKMLSEAAGLLNQMKDSPLLPPSLQMSHHNNPQPPPPPMLLTPPGVPPHHAINLQTQEHLKKGHSQSHSPLQQGGLVQQSMRSLHQHISPSVYEMAALTQDLDTQVITTKIKEALLANNIGQKIFGEAVLGLSQGSVSELLSKPKPWHMLSIKGREPFIRMQLWLNDAHNIDRLQALKNERREANKRRRSSGPGNHDNSSDTSSNDTSEYYHSNSPGPGPPAPKKQRVLFTEYQKLALNVAYELKNYPNQADTDFLAGELALPDRTVSNWFHNHRMRLKPSGNATDRDQAANQPPLDPARFRLLLGKRMMEMSQERIGLGNIPIGYPYLANPNIAALISRGLLQSGDIDLSALNNAVKEQISGLDLSMGIKRESEFEDDDMDSNVGSEDSNISGSLEVKIEQKEQPVSQSRSSRRKPAAPQWVNPDWQDEKEKQPQTGDEVIINGVCVMQTEDYGRRNAEETIRIEPTPVLDRFEDDQSETSSVSAGDEKPEEEKATEETDAEKSSIKEENLERWDY